MIIDIHTHAWPEKVAHSARENLETLFKVRMVDEPTVPTLLRFMDKNAIETSVICAVATKPEQVPSINTWLFGVRNQRLRVFAAMHPAYPKWKDELKRIRSGADGIKLQPEFQDFYVDDESLYPVYEMIEQLGLPVLFHCGEELSGTMQVRSSPERLMRVHKRFPGLTIVAAHFGGFRLWEEVKAWLLGSDVYLDTSFFFGFLPDDEVRKMLLAHRQDRLLFGSDFPLIDQKQDIDFLAGLKLSSELLERIFSLNARSLLGM